jgi:hypothetical protein
VRFSPAAARGGSAIKGGFLRHHPIPQISHKLSPALVRCSRIVKLKWILAANGVHAHPGG